MTDGSTDESGGRRATDGSSGRVPTSADGIVEMPVLAHVPWRMAAYFVDTIAILVVSLALGLALRDASLPATPWIVFLVSESALIVIPIARTGRTIGAAALGIRVARRSDFGPPGYATSLTRWLVPHLGAFVASGVLAVGVPSFFEVGLSAVAFVAWVVVYAYMWPSELNQGLHDVAADTIVVVDRRNVDRTLRVAEAGQ